jgi:nucleoside-diphosphate-sugar epimerase
LERYFWRDPVEYPGPLNIGSEREIPVTELARYIRRMFGNLQIHHLDPVLQDPTGRRPNLTLAKSLLPGWACKVSYERGVQLIVDRFRGQVGQNWELIART